MNHVPQICASVRVVNFSEIRKYYFAVGFNGERACFFYLSLHDFTPCAPPSSAEILDLPFTTTTTPHVNVFLISCLGVYNGRRRGKDVIVTHMMGLLAA